MDRAKMKVDTLEVQSFTTSGGGTAVVERPGMAEKEVDIRAGEYSDMLGNTERCDTDRDCSGVCLVATNVCSPC